METFIYIVYFFSCPHVQVSLPLSLTSVHQIIKQYSIDLTGPACVTHAKSITHEDKFPCLWIPFPLQCPLHHHWKKTRSWTSQMVSFSSSLSPGPPRRTAHKHKRNTPSSQHQWSLLSAALHTGVCFVQRASSRTNALPSFQITLLPDHHQRHDAEAEILERQSSALFSPWRRGRNLGAPILCPLFKSLFCQIIINIIIQRPNLGSATTIYTIHYKSVPFTPKAQWIKYAILTQKSGPHNTGICCFNHLEVKRK